MSNREAYAQARTTLNDARFTMLAHRLTYSVVQTRLREAALEEAAEQVAHLEERIATLAPIHTADARRMMALTVEAEQLRALAVAGELDQMLATLLPAMETIGVRVRALAADLASAATLAERAQAYANMLPRETIRQRVAANEIAARVQAMSELTSLLAYLMGEEPAHDRREQEREAGKSNPQRHWHPRRDR
jgi:hypothetical protein